MAKTSKGLVDYCRAQLGKPYWWGTFGQNASVELLAAKRAQYPGYYASDDFKGQFGQRVHDCVGLIKGYRWSDTPDSAPRYEASQDVAVGGLYNQCDMRGDIPTMPDIPGVCVFMANMGHVGVYIGNGQVIEARGHAYGVVQTPLAGRGWAYWGMPDWIEYSNQPEDKPAVSNLDTTYMYSVKLPLLKYGAVGGYVRTAQQLLIASGFGCGPDGADGDYGKNTVNAVKKFQQLHGLLDDGEIGGETWVELLKNK